MKAHPSTGERLPARARASTGGLRPARVREEIGGLVGGDGTRVKSPVPARLAAWPAARTAGGRLILKPRALASHYRRRQRPSAAPPPPAPHPSGDSKAFDVWRWPGSVSSSRSSPCGSSRSAFHSRGLSSLFSSSLFCLLILLPIARSQRFSYMFVQFGFSTHSRCSIEIQLGCGRIDLWKPA